MVFNFIVAMYFHGISLLLFVRVMHKQESLFNICKLAETFGNVLRSLIS